MQCRLKRFFQDPRLRAMFTFQDLYVGLTPYTAPAVFSLLAGTELTDGVWYPMGGFGQVGLLGGTSWQPSGCFVFATEAFLHIFTTVLLRCHCTWRFVWVLFEPAAAATC